MSTWTCPYCHHDQAVTGPTSEVHFVRLGLEDLVYGDVGVELRARGCANPKCGRLEILADVTPFQPGRGGKARTLGAPLFSGRLVPQGTAQVLADYVPPSIRQDYQEACLIRDLSPRSSAALARRCLEAIIRDFGQRREPSGGVLGEITALASSVEAGAAPPGVSVESIAALRSVLNLGQIAAHMEAEAETIGAVDPGEAEALIALLESLFDGWYNERHRRTETFAKVTAGAGMTPPPALDLAEPLSPDEPRHDQAHVQLAEARARLRAATYPVAQPHDRDQS